MTAAHLPTRPGKFFDPTTEVHFDEALDTWHVFSLGDVQRVLSGEEHFSSGYGLTDETRPLANPVLSGMWAADGQRHRDLRAAVADPFSPRVMSRLETQIRAIATELVDGLEPGGFDVVPRIAKPLPTRVICHLLGLDLSAEERMTEWLEQWYQDSVTTNTVPRQAEMAEFFAAELDRQRAEPGDGLIAELLAVQATGYQVGGRPMSDWDLIGYCAMLLGAGVDTTAATIPNAVLFLTEFGCWEELRADPSLIPGAVEETMRWYPVFPAPRRLVLRDVTIGGQEISAGQWVSGWLSAANRDPVRYADPDTFDIRRRTRIMTFGHGPHHCLGAGLARLEKRVLLEEMVRRLPLLRRDTGAPLVRRQWMLDNLETATFRFD
ncbi:cytochrome P450 [Lentzea flaviverrucosa]|uniref:Cytochrome P450 TylI n=1 Tax=Lentzea flaviverrucosa TaxID=200379 RepID=A0A1H9XPT0_9PSEU|nr:cytochrome P450 [Lentzea flaviverrucosa]RDI19753.1 cytochrome P450 TylI [Lentzea flaviverrucosa]SES48165.1 cytochrome P450 TylI [Lentzea flaviverrucosa]